MQKVQLISKRYISTGGFTVLAGSKVSDHTVPSLETRGKTYYILRNTLVKEEVIKDGVFQKDYEFNAPSAASAVVLGHTSNGNVDWKTEDGTKLKDLQDDKDINEGDWVYFDLNYQIFKEN